MPIIQAFLDRDHEVILASDGESLDLLRTEYPQLESLVLPSYEVTYGSSLGFQWAILSQIPKFLRTIKKEQKVLADYLKANPVDQLISDNRWGCYSADCPSVFMTHQLFLKLGPRQKYLEKLLARFQARFLKRFTSCWVPDFEGSDNLSGDLSHPKKSSPYTIPISFIGPLSRFSLFSVNERRTRRSDNETKESQLLFLLSGPEPARSIFETLIVKQLYESGEKAVLVRGTKQGRPLAVVPPDLEIHELLSARELYPLIQQAKMIVCRSGYSSVMDMICLNKKAILVPTPGQTEQEYVADHLMSNPLFGTTAQENFNLLGQLKARIENRREENELVLNDQLLAKAIDYLCDA
ncbi:glycosyl transferase family 28 [Chitinophagales bacterium]|nr:glycosyl transferase family 28 [Chitinophagales bacterium]